MTDFVSRVAARAIGATAAARPRLAGLFEPVGSAGDATLEVVDEEIVTPAPARRGEAPGATERGRQAAPLVDAPPVEVAQPADPTAVPAARRPAPFPDFVAQSNYVPAPHSAIRARVPEPEPVPAAHLGQGVAPPVAAAAPLTQALPVAAVVREAAPPPAAPAPQVKEPPVRVHIGRLEVRANVQPPPPPERPRRQTPRSDGLSLTDYLRGKREARA